MLFPLPAAMPSGRKPSGSAMRSGPFPASAPEVITEAAMSSAPRSVRSLLMGPVFPCPATRKPRGEGLGALPSVAATGSGEAPDALRRADVDLPGVERQERLRLGAHSAGEAPDRSDV